jgi:ribose-phosphate pyrophosphokinase
MYKISKYPDGTSYVNVVSSDPVIFRTNSYEDLWHLSQYVDSFNAKYGFPPTITIPNLLDAQADRRFNQGESFGLKLVLTFLKSLNVKQYYIFHPHNAEVVEAVLTNSTIINNTEFIKKSLNEYVMWWFGPGYDGFQKESKLSQLILMSADAGGYKPLMKLCDDITWRGGTYSASKSRKYENGKTTLTQLIDRDDFGGKDILIVDDISVGGGTFKGLAKLLRERNVGKLYLAVSHITVQNDKKQDGKEYEPLVNFFDHVYTTNSKFDDYWIEDSKGEPIQPQNLRVIKMFDI